MYYSFNSTKMDPIKDNNALFSYGIIFPDVVNTGLPWSIRMHFCKKVVLITGASSGIGKATALLFSEFGAQLILVSRNLENLKRVATECHMPCGHAPLIVPADVTRENDILRVEKEVISRFGRLDVLLNIAGGIIPETLLEADVKRFDRNIDLNLKSVYMMMSRFIPHLEKSKGNIVNVSSIVSDIMLTGHCGYNVSKAGVEFITKYAAAELVSKGIRVNCVKPGFTRTKLLEYMGYTVEESGRMFEDMKDKMPLGRVIEPREVAQAIAYLASEPAKNVTGLSLTVDGGQILAGPSAITVDDITQKNALE